MPQSKNTCYYKVLMKTTVGVLTYLQWKLELQGTAVSWFYVVLEA